MVPEGRQLFTQMTVDENLMVGAHGTRARKVQNETIDTVYELFPRLQERRDQQAGSLSGGEQQMLAVGRGLMARPSVLALDEPSLGLAPIVVDHVFGVIEKIKETGITILLIEQNVQQTLELADRGYVIENGRITMEGTGDELLRDDYLKTTYMGI
jgi:branched-chain amino acid transport system ATP-binding protein